MDAEIHDKILAKGIQENTQRPSTMINRWFNVHKSINVEHHINSEKQNHMVISEKVFDKAVKRRCNISHRSRKIGRSCPRLLSCAHWGTLLCAGCVCFPLCGFYSHFIIYKTFLQEFSLKKRKLLRVKFPWV